MKILVLRPTPKVNKGFSSILPLDLGQIQAVLKKDDNVVTVLDLELEFEDLIQKSITNKQILENGDVDLFLKGAPLSSPSSRLILKQLDKIVNLIISKIDTDFDLIVNSISYERNIFLSLAISKYLKEHFGSKVIVGGSMTPYRNFISDYSFVDFVQSGSISDLKFLINSIENSTSFLNVPSLQFRENEKILNSNFKSKIDYSLICPDFEGLDFQKYLDLSGELNLLVPYSFISGCTFNCAFCRFCLEKHFDFKSPEDVKKDLIFLKNQTGSSNFYFLNNTLNISETFLLPYLEVINDVKIIWSDSARSSLISESLAKQMKDSGCDYLIFGVESFIDSDLMYINKRLTSSDILTSLKNCHDVGITCKINLMSGLPFQRFKDLKDRIEFLNEVSPYIGRVSVARYFTSGEMRSNPSKYGIKLDGPMGFSEIDGFDKSQIAKEAILVEDFYEDFFTKKGIKVSIGFKTNKILF